jgi:hypothetical protein
MLGKIIEKDGKKILITSEPEFSSEIEISFIALGIYVEDNFNVENLSIEEILDIDPELIITWYVEDEDDFNSLSTDFEEIMEENSKEEFEMIQEIADHIDFDKPSSVEKTFSMNTKEKRSLKLCYVDDLDNGQTLLLYFTNKNAEDVWGDDWDDAPYEHNAGEPYIEEGMIQEKLIIIANNCYFETWEAKQYPNSRYSVKDINQDRFAIPWFFIKNYSGKNKFLFFANNTIDDLYKLIEENNLQIEIFKQVK